MIYDDMEWTQNNKAIYLARLIISSQEDIKNIERQENFYHNMHV